MEECHNTNVIVNPSIPVAKVDGSEEDEIHCLKAGDAAHAAASLITNATLKILKAGDAESDDEDPFADIHSMQG